jgi:uncharacterized protein YndB with AHSA1/START domain
MAMSNEKRPNAESTPLVMTRTFSAPREMVFRAWTSADHLRQWFCPTGYTVPAAQVEFRVGGAFNICMRSAAGQDHWTKGHYVEIVPNTRLAIDMTAVGAKDEPLFRAYTVATFSDECAGTRLEVTQSYTVYSAQAEPMIGGAEQGWAQTLDRLELEVSRIRDAEPPVRSAVHATFSIERTYRASPEQVFKAFTDPVAKAKWFSGGGSYTLLAREMDVRPGGRERVQGRWDTGMVSTFDAVYFDVVPNERIVYAYEMHLDERKISVSVATLDIRVAQSGTRLIVTEQGVFLDGYDDAGSREHGTGFLLDALGASLPA